MYTKKIPCQILTLGYKHKNHNIFNPSNKNIKCVHFLCIQTKQCNFVFEYAKENEIDIISKFVLETKMIMT